jgi:hypothetical protein
MSTIEDSPDTGVGTVITEPAPTPTPRKRSRTLGTLLRNTDNMISAIQEHMATLSPKFDDSHIQALNGLIGDINTLDNDQEILKGKLKEKTAELEGKVQQLKGVIGQYAMIIKAVIPQKRWVDFGISAKR